MIIAKSLAKQFSFITAILFLLSGCATMQLNYQDPSVELISFKMLPAKGFEQNFEIGLKLTNPNNFELPLNGISYQLSVAGSTLAHGVANNIPTASAYGESRFIVPLSTSLLTGIKVIKALMDSQGQEVSYQLKADLDIDIPLIPTITIIEKGLIPFAHKSL
ncbi:LEA type 2 family protein [Colwellia ponticola]|uniref:LEA type 2 family protein n=1 Tax=Colwellia ponticola TaxID=2304625 RepID=A0A8H2JKP2_9GAMM|nr:LEA type 2 family protein [Colwellia ponticola]TMM45057.1 LEA type 2 family protein [Colwellia ponticola]